MSCTVAIDGPAAAGKGTIARAVAKRFGLNYLDTGLLYRAVGARYLEGETPRDAAQALQFEDLERQDLRSGHVAEAASKVAALPEVRAALVDFQRAFVRRAGGAVLDGRDIGSVICPDADVKLFVSASPEVRSARRYKELIERGEPITLEAVAADLARRDARDEGRGIAALIPATDAVRLDTTDLTEQDAIAKAIYIVQTQCGFP